MPNQVLNIPVVKVGTPKNSTVPKSANASIAANVTPNIIAGLAIGIDILKNILNCDAPNICEFSYNSFDCSKKAPLAKM